MVNLLILTCWMLSGAVLSTILASPSGPRWGWAPMGIVFGPLWAIVAVDQREAARTR